MRFYSTEQLSPRQLLLPSGTLWARDAVVARTGVQRYHITELPDVADTVVTDSTGMFDVERDATDVFSPDSMASFEGVPVTLGHPIDQVGPDTWRDLAVGHAANVHRSGDTLVADLLISDRRGIHAVRELGYRALSAGYEARYQPIGDGRLRQCDIVANHIALLSPNEEARCGAVCCVGDSMTGRQMMHTRDVIGPVYSSNWTPMGSDPNSLNIGGELVQLLDNRFGYYIATDGRNQVALFRTVVADGLGDGRMSGGASPAAAAIRNTSAYPASGTELMRDAQVRDRERQGRNHIGSINAAFWAKH